VAARLSRLFRTRSWIDCWSAIGRCANRWHLGRIAASIGGLVIGSLGVFMIGSIAKAMKTRSISDSGRRP